MNTDHSSSAYVARGPRKTYVAEIFFVVMFLGGFLLPWSIWLWFRFTPNTVLATAGVGRFVSTSKGNDATNILTTEGTVAIDGTLSALRGSRLVIQRSTKRGTELCVTGAPQSCVALAGSWTEPLHAVPRSKHVINFYAYGISAYNLRIWRMFGFLMTFASFIAAGAEINDNHPELGRG